MEKNYEPLLIGRPKFKKYNRNNSIGRPDIQSFVGALSSKGLNTKGVFITTSKFTNEAKSFISHTTNIVLIDGKELAQLMMEYELGVSTQQTFIIQKIDTDYFEEWFIGIGYKYSFSFYKTKLYRF